MSESVEQKAIRKSVLEEVHARLGATMRVQDGWSVPASYGAKESEYAAVRERGDGLIDLSSRGCLLVTGSEAVSFLNGLITNDMKSLDENRWMPAAFPNVQGRLIASVRVIRVQDDTTGNEAVPVFLIDTEAVTHVSILKMLKRFTLAGDFRVADLSGELSTLSLQGKQALRIVRMVLGEPGAVGKYQAQQVPWLSGIVSVIRATHTAEDGYDVLVQVQDTEALWGACLEAGARPVGYDTLEILRIEAGHPRYGVDMDETNVVLETNLDDAVSFTKGCYTGQEIIARIKYRGHVAKKLTGLIFNETAEIKVGAKILSQDNKEIGRVTSATFSPVLNCTIALAYVKYDYLAPGTAVKAVSGDGQFEALVSELPFVRGSWYTNSVKTA
jgi:folate-binding protein YgfZ